MMGEPPRGEDHEDAFNGGGGGGGGEVSDDQSSAEEGGAGLVSGTGSMSSGSRCSSWSSLITDDDGDSTADSSTAVAGDHASAFFSSSSSSSDTMHLDGDGDGGPLYELLPLLEHLPVRTGLSRYYQGKSQSFTSLSDAKCLKDLAKKSSPPYGVVRTCRAARRGSAASRSSSAISRRAPGLCSKAIAKKTAAPRGSSDRLLSRARSTGILHSNSSAAAAGGAGKPPAYQSKKDLSSSNIFF